MSARGETLTVDLRGAVDTAIDGHTRRSPPTRRPRCKRRSRRRQKARVRTAKSDPVSWDTALVRMTVTKEAGHGDEAMRRTRAAPLFEKKGKVSFWLGV